MTVAETMALINECAAEMIADGLIVVSRPPGQQRLSDLAEERREALFVLMREWDAESTDFFAKARLPYGTIPVGGALFDETLRGAIRLEFVMALRKAETIDGAVELAEPAIRRWIEKHNEKRPKDANWKRWCDRSGFSGQDDLFRLADLARKAVA